MKLYKIKDYILNLLFPIKCVSCGTLDTLICDECINKIPMAERETERNILAVFDYRNEIMRKIIWELKYHHKRSLGVKLGNILYESMIEEISNIKLFSIGSPIIVIPVPISINKMRKRGYNQSLSIAEGFCEKNNNSFQIENKIIFRKNNKDNPQARISNRRERLLNVRDAFYIKDEDKIKNKIVIVIDDVTTTGGTITEVMKILKKNGATKVIGMAVAH